MAGRNCADVASPPSGQRVVTNPRKRSAGEIVKMGKNCRDLLVGEADLRHRLVLVALLS
jgi:hypothetical protein